MAFYSALDQSIFEFALTGLEQRKAQLDAQIEHARQQLGWKSTPTPISRSPKAVTAAQPAIGKRRRKRTMSAEGRARIAATQRKRWAALKKKAKASR